MFGLSAQSNVENLIDEYIGHHIEKLIAEY